MRRVMLKAADGDREVTVETGGSVHRVTIVRNGVTGPPVEIHDEPTGVGAGRLRLDRRERPYRFVRRGNEILVWVGGRSHRFEIVSRTARRAAGSAAAEATGDLVAPMPGRVLAVNAPVGSTFAAHDAIIVMESMKMEMTLSVPHGGTVAELLCEVDQLVEMGDLLARLDLTEPDA